MDSGTNSASLQSSSTGGVVGGGVGGGDEEYDSSRAVTNSDAFSSAFHTQNSAMFDPFANFNPIYRPQPPSSPPPPPPSQNYTSTGNSIFDIDWSPAKRLRSDQITTNSNPLLLSSNNSSQFLNNSLSFGGITPGSISFPSSSQEHQHRSGGSGGGNVSVATSTVSAAAAAADQPITQPAARNPKKRSRASRRAPTTVLTTDTTNFRAMVQEFTGIPAPPFTTPSYFPQRNRFDLFGSTPNSAMRSAAAVPAAAAANNNPFSISQPPPLNYLRRAFLQSIQQPPPFISPSSASSSSPLMLNCLPNNFASCSSTTSSAANSSINYQLPRSGVVNSVSSASNAPINYQLPSSSGGANSVTQGSDLFSRIQQNSMFTSLLQSPEKYSIGSKEQEQFQLPSNSSSQFQMASNSSSQFQMPSSVNNNIQHGHLLSELPNLISPEQAPAAASSNDNSINAANFHGDKVQETVASRGGEGMVESWLLSSD